MFLKLGCESCGPGEPCGVSNSVAQKASEEQQLRKNRQYAIFGAVLLLFLLRWFHVVGSVLGVDAALLAIFIGAAPIYGRALDSLLKKQLNTDVLIAIALVAVDAMGYADSTADDFWIYWDDLTV